MKKKLLIALTLCILATTVLTGAAFANTPGNGGNPNGGCVAQWWASPAATTAATAYIAQYGRPMTKSQRMAMASTLNSLAIAACTPPPPVQ